MPGTRRGTIPCNNLCRATFSGFKTLWLCFHHPYISQHFDTPTTNASYNIQQAALTLNTQATTPQSEDQSTYVMASKSGIENPI